MRKLDKEILHRATACPNIKEIWVLETALPWISGVLDSTTPMREDPLARSVVLKEVVDRGDVPSQAIVIGVCS
jgi:hypothetical protein